MIPTAPLYPPLPEYSQSTNLSLNHLFTLKRQDHKQKSKLVILQLPQVQNLKQSLVLPNVILLGVQHQNTKPEIAISLAINLQMDIRIKYPQRWCKFFHTNVNTLSTLKGGPPFRAPPRVDYTLRDSVVNRYELLPETAQRKLKLKLIENLGNSGSCWGFMLSYKPHSLWGLQFGS